MTMQEIFDRIEATTPSDWYRYQETYTLLSDASIAIHFSIMDDDVPDLEKDERARFTPCGGYMGTTQYFITYYGTVITGGKVVVVGDEPFYKLIPFHFGFPGETKPDEPNNVSKLDAHVCWLLGDEVDKDAYVALLIRAHVHVKPYVDGTCKIEDWV